jgi:hypothetical protein
MIVDRAYTAVNHKVTVVNDPYFTRLASTVLRPFVGVSYTIKNGNALKIEYSIVYNTTKYGRNTVNTKRQNTIKNGCLQPDIFDLGCDLTSQVHRPMAMINNSTRYGRVI